MASLQPTQLLHALKVTRGDLSIKTPDSGVWVRLESPQGDKNHNCYGVVFDGGITVVQVNRKTGGTYISEPIFPIGHDLGHVRPFHTIWGFPFLFCTQSFRTCIIFDSNFESQFPPLFFIKVWAARSSAQAKPTSALEFFH